MKTHRGRQARNTLIFAVLVAAVGVGGLLYGAFGRKVGSIAILSVGGAEIARLALSEDVTFPVGNAEKGYNIVCVEDGAVFVKEADCPDRICVREGKKHRNGETIACLPHQLLIQVADEASYVDGVAH